MNAIEINLADPFNNLRAIVLALPADDANTLDHDFANEEDLAQAIRNLYEAAHGRFVETQIGPIAIAPPVSGFLKAARFSVRTRAEFLGLLGTKSSFRTGPSGVGIVPKHQLQAKI